MTQDIKTYLKESHAEELPDWLANHSKGAVFDRAGFFDSRLVYYPGYFDDGQPVKLFGGGHASHAFVYADYGVTRKDLVKRLESEEQGFRGYHTFDRIELTQSDLVPKGWQPTLSGLSSRHTPGGMQEGAPYGFVEILERDSGHDDGHGPARLAILFLGADGFATYDALFCQPGSKVRPYAVLLQDHGFGGNYDNFGADGLLFRIAQQAQIFPHFLLVADDGTKAWPGYERVETVEPDLGGMYAAKRVIYAEST